MDKKEIIEKLQKLRSDDPYFQDGKIISSVSTQPLDVALDAWRIYSDVNALDTYIFSSVARLEEEIIGWMGRLLSCRNASGYVSTGGTESNIAALYAAKKMNPGKKEIIAPVSAHYSIDKAADLMGLRVKRTPLDENFRADASAIKKEINKNTLAVIATAGTASLGMLDPAEEIARDCGDVLLHVDAAYGGFMLPFIKKRLSDFRLDNIDSLTIDPHKMGCAPMPAGAILFRDESYRKEMLVKPSYIPIETSTLSGSRSGGAIAAVWATINFFGREGYEKMTAGCMKNTALLCGELEKIPGSGIVTEPDLNIVGVRLPDIDRTSAELMKKGWKIAVNRDLSCMRFAVMPHVTKETIYEFTEDLKKIVK
ncbi:MAG: tyrosine decarboxylase MfnA [Candidatus Altiarchaeia archaeon]